MRKRSEILLVLASIFLLLSVVADYKSSDFNSLKEDSIDYVILANTYYIASHNSCQEGYSCIWENLSYPEVQRTELKKFQDQADKLRGIIGFWSAISRLFLVLSMLIHVYVIYYERIKKK